MSKRLFYLIFVLFIHLFTCSAYSEVTIDGSINDADTYDGVNKNGVETEILHCKSAIIAADFKFVDNIVRTVIETKISDISWTYSVSSDSSVTCTPKHGTGDEARVTVTSRKTGTYTITVKATVSYKVTTYAPNGTTIHSKYETETGNITFTLIVKRPGNIKLVDVGHTFNYAPMDMAGKWGLGKDFL